MAQKFYFLRTVLEGKNRRLRALPFQTEPDGRPVICDLNIQGNMDIRNSYPLGTVFGTDTLINRVNQNTPFYGAGDIKPLVDRKDLLSPDHEAPDEMREAYTRFLAEHDDKINPPGSPSTGLFSEAVKPGRPLTLLEKIKRNPRLAKPSVESCGFWVDDTVWWPLMIALVKEGKTIFFSGPQGSGKTDIVRLAAERLGLPLHIYDMGSMYDPISEMLGVHRMTEKGSVFDYAQFTQDIQHEGIVLLDELSRATPAVNNILLSLLDWRKTLPVEMASSKDTRKIKVHPKCHIIATMNLGPQFVGANNIDIALNDRKFLRLEMSYMPADAEISLLMRSYKIAKADAVNIVNTAQTVRNIYNKGDLQVSISTRMTLIAAELVADGFSAREAMQLVFLPDFEGTNSEGERAVVWQTILAN